MLLYSTIAIVLGFIVDLLIGDPRGFPHIVILMGRLITVFEKFLRKVFPNTAQGERFAGRMLVVLMLSFAFAVIAVIHLCYRFVPAVGLIIEVFLVWQLLCMHDLKKESMVVYDKLKKENLKGAQHAVSMIVGRDTEVLDETGVAKAAIETVAENTSDGIIAPLFYMLLFGGSFGLLYKAVNTMDSMVGYKNNKYLNFGRAGALTDDVFNAVPARLAALLMIVGAKLCGYNAKNAARICKRDCRKHASPNSAFTESACAGALEIQLAGDAWYFGKLHKKDYIGDPIRQVEIEDIPRANRLMMTTSILMLVIGIVIRVAFIIGGML